MKRLRDRISEDNGLKGPGGDLMGRAGRGANLRESKILHKIFPSH